MLPTWMGPFAALSSALTWAVGSAYFSSLGYRYSSFSINYSRAVLAIICFSLSLMLYHLNSHFSFMETLQGISIEQFTFLTLSVFSSYVFGDQFFYRSAKYLGASGALAIGSSYPVFIATFSFLSGREVFYWHKLLGVLLCVGGTVFILMSPKKSLIKEVYKEESIQLPRGKVQAQNQKKYLGLFFALCAATSWGLNVFCVSQAGQNQDGTVLNPLLISWIRMALSILLIQSIGPLFTKQRVKLVDWKEFKKNGWIFVFESFLGTIAFVYGLNHSSLSVGVTLVALSPAISVPFSILFKTEEFSFRRTLGVISTVIGGILLVAI